MNKGLDKWDLSFVIYMFLSNNPSSGDINSSNLPCYVISDQGYNLTSPFIRWSYTCIFMNIYEIEKKGEIHVKTIRDEGGGGWGGGGGGGEVRWLIIRPCTLKIFSHACQIVKWGPLNKK